MIPRRNIYFWAVTKWSHWVLLSQNSIFSRRFIIHWWHFAWYLIKIFRISVRQWVRCEPQMSIFNSHSNLLGKKKQSWHIFSSLKYCERDSDINYKETIENFKWNGEIPSEMCSRPSRWRGARKEFTNNFPSEQNESNRKSNPKSKLLL